MEIQEFRTLPAGRFFETRPIFSQGDRASRAVGYFRESGQYELFLSGLPRAIGLTTRDLLTVSDPETKLGNIAYSMPTLSEKDTVAQAAKLMYDYRLRAVPSAPRGGEVNVVSIRGLLKELADMARLSKPCSEIMTASPLTINEQDSVRKAREVMTDRSFDHLPVLKDGRLRGMVTSSDILFHLMQPERGPSRGELSARFDYQVSRISQEPGETVPASKEIGAVLHDMMMRGSTYVLIGRPDKIEGIATLRDLMKPLLVKEEKKAPYYIVGLPSEPFEAEAVKAKFERLGESLMKAFPSIRELRAVVKSKEPGAGRRRYEVNFDAYMRSGVHAFSEEGYDLAEVFDKALPKLKRMLSSRQSKVTRSRGRTVRRGYEHVPA